MDKHRVAQELMAVAKELMSSEADVYDKLRDLVITRTPPEYAKAAALVKSNRRIKFDYMKDIYKALRELASMQEDIEKKHEEMWELWSEVGRLEDKVNRMVQR